VTGRDSPPLEDGMSGGGAPASPWPELPPWSAAFLQAQLADRARWPHALLLSGTQGIGKRATALHLAQALLCETAQTGGGACGLCASCRYVAAGQHPDLRVLEPFVLDDEGAVKAVDDIAVDRIRDIRSFLELTSHRGGSKVAVIVPAERMNVAAANALLKTLEEPPPATYLLLVSHQPGRLPATIISRCQRIPVPMPDRAEALRWLQVHGIADAAAVLAQAGGAPLAALDLAEPASQAERRVWLTALSRPESLSPSVLSARIDAGARDERRGRLAAAVDWLVAWSADLARATAGAPPARNPDFAGPLGILATRVARISLSRYHRSLLERRTLLNHPLAPRLVAEAMLLDYQALFTDASR
jgi:DNA polymerase III subunit delta'